MAKVPIIVGLTAATGGEKANVGASEGDKVMVSGGTIHAVLNDAGAWRIPAPKNRHAMTFPELP